MMRWAKRHKISCRDYSDYSELARRREIAELVKGEIYGLNLILPECMCIHKIALINKQLDTDEELTKTGTARRKFLFEQYRDILDAIYADKSEDYLIARFRDNDDEIRTIKTRIRIITIPEGGR